MGGGGAAAPTLPRLAPLLPLLAVACAPETPRVPATIGVGRLIEDGEPLPEGAVTLAPHAAQARLGRGPLRVVPRELEVERARIRRPDPGNHYLYLTWTPESGAEFAEFSASCVDRQLALFVDWEYFLVALVESPLGEGGMNIHLPEWTDDEAGALLDRLDP